MHSLLELKDITKTFAGNIAVDGVSLQIAPSQIVALVGESGCGKTTTARTIAGLEKADRGEIILEGNKLLGLSERPKNIKRKIQMIFQNVLGSFNPKFSIFNSLAQPILEHKSELSLPDLKNELEQLVESVGLSPKFLSRYPHQLSGGQLQRAAIARALACEPSVLIADEPTSALDVSIRGQILRLFRDLKKKKGLSILIISHDLSAMKPIADEMHVMHKGKIIESDHPVELFSNPKTAYTKKLISSIPTLNPSDKVFG